MAICGTMRAETEIQLPLSVIVATFNVCYDDELAPNEEKVTWVVVSEIESKFAGLLIKDL